MRFAPSIAAMCAACSAPAEEPLVISAAASLERPLTALAASFERAHPGTQVRLNLGASSALARQLALGAPADLFIAADQRTMDQIAAEILPGTRVDLLSNTLVALVPAESALQAARPADLASPAVRRLALPDAAVPLGAYARAYLESQGLWNTLAPRVVRTEDARATLAAVNGGNADLALVYRTDARLARTARVLLELEGGPPIVYPAAVLSRTRQPELARELMALMRSEEGAQAFRAAGFQVLDR